MTASVTTLDTRGRRVIHLDVRGALGNLPGMGITVLVVDDSDAIRRLVMMQLRAVGVEVIGEAENGALALEMIERSQPDVVVMDREMPILDGPTTTRAIKERWPDISVVGLTSYPMGLLEAAGASPVFSKTDELDACINYLTSLDQGEP